MIPYSQVKLATHDGPFHADDINAYILLAKRFKNHSLTRTRNIKLLSEGEVVFDVGNSEFDHHSEGSLQYRNNGFPYSSFGLVWRKFGMEVLENNYGLTGEDATYVFEAFDKSYVQGVDALDNGYDIGATTYDISKIVVGFYPNWDSEVTDWDKSFYEAVNYVTIAFDNLLSKLASTVRSKKTIQEAFANRENPKILVIENSCPWQEELLKLDTEKEVLYIVFKDSSSNEYRIQTVPQTVGSFIARKQLPSAWGGKPIDTLNEIIGISDAVFCHTGLFIAGAKSKKSIMKMASLATL